MTLSLSSAPAHHVATIAPRVLVLVAAHDVGGPVKGVFQLLDAFERRPGRFELLNFRVPGTGQSPFERAARARGIDVRFLEHRPRAPWSTFAELGEHALRYRADIIQTHGFKPTMHGLYLKARLGIPWICFLHGQTAENAKVRFYHALDHVAQRAADRVVVVAEVQRALVLGGSSRRRVRVISNAVDPDRPARRATQPFDVRAAHGIGRDEPLVVALGRLSPEKGLDVLLGAIALLPETVRPTVLLAGDGPERQRLEELARELSIPDRVRFAGAVDTPGDYLLAADLVVMPSRSEACPNVLLEALALERPMVATAVGAVPDIVEPDVHALIVPPGDEIGLAAAIERALGDPALRDRIARAGHERVRRYTPEARADALWSLYEEILAGRA